MKHYKKNVVKSKCHMGPPDIIKALFPLEVGPEHMPEL